MLVFADQGKEGKGVGLMDLVSGPRENIRERKERVGGTGPTAGVSFFF